MKFVVQSEMAPSIATSLKLKNDPVIHIVDLSEDLDSESDNDKKNDIKNIEIKS